jgi:hypothetical protein
MGCYQANERIGLWQFGIVTQANERIGLWQSGIVKQRVTAGTPLSTWLTVPRANNVQSNSSANLYQC